VTVAPLGESDDLVIAELRPGRANDRRRRTTPHWTGGPRLRIYALGRTRIERAEGPIGGQWLENVVYPEEIVETLWEDARLRSVPGVRYYIHQLRQYLEPDRAGRGQSSFIGRLEGGYVLRPEMRTLAGLRLAAGDLAAAAAELERLAELESTIRRSTAS
jgi:hypothetical protein